MEIPKNSFLFRLYVEFKLLFVVMMIWIVGTLWFAMKSREEFPFLLFGMYSLQEEPKEEYITYSIVVNGKEMIYQNLPDAKQELIESSLSHAVTLKTNPLANSGFINWLKAYTADGEPVEIYKLTCLYSEEGKPEIKKRELIYPHDQL
jgi:hypothetical protein